MAKCPYCDFETPDDDGGSSQMWQEVAHMQTEHPEIISLRMREDVLDADPDFGSKDKE